MTTNQAEKYAFEPFSSVSGILRGEPFKIMPLGTFYRGDRKLEITKTRLEQMAANVKSGLPRFRIPINTDHKQDVGKVGTIQDVEFREDGADGPGLYAVKYELTEKGKKLVQEDGYDAPSAEVMWSLNGAKYQDPTTGKYHDNVLAGMALTPKPFFGHDNVSLYSATAPAEITEKFEDANGAAGMMHRVRTAVGLMKRVITALDVTKSADPDEDGDDDTLTQIVNETPEPGPGGQPVPDLPAPVQKGTPQDMTDAGVMKNQLPRAVTSQVQTSEVLLSAPAAGAEQFAGNLPPMMDCPECGTKMPQGGKCIKCGYQDKGEGDKADAEKMSVSRARTAKAGRQPDQLGSRKETHMSTQTSEETFAVKPEEFAALKAKADQFDALKQQVDTYAAQLQQERNTRRLEKFTAIAEDYTALPVEAKATAEKFAAIEDGAGPDVLKWVMERFAAFDKALTEAGLFSEVASKRSGGQTETFADAVDHILRDKFNGAPEKYSDAMALAMQAHPDLYADYRGDYAQNRGR